MCVCRGSWKLVVRGTLVGAVGGRPLLVVRCWWSLVGGGRLIVCGTWGCMEKALYYVVALLPRISQGLTSTCFLSAACAQRSKHCTAGPRKVEMDWILSLSLSACSCCCLRRALKKVVSSLLLGVGLVEELVQKRWCLAGVEPSSWDSFGEDLSQSAPEPTESEISVDSC